LGHFGREEFTLWTYSEESHVGDPQRLSIRLRGCEPGEAVPEADTHFKALSVNSLDLIVRLVVIVLLD